MKVSVIIPTYNRSKKVLRTLNALQSQSGATFEIVVVVDGSTDDTVVMLEKYRSKHSLRVIVQQNKGRAGSRNAGALLATGEVLIFYDDDMLPEAGSVAGHLRFHYENSAASILAANPSEIRTQSATDFHNYRADLSRKWLTPYRNGPVRLGFDNLFLAGANFSVKRASFNRLGGFDDGLRDHEDYDLGYRALEAGLEVWFDYDNLAVHDDGVTCKAYVKRLKQYAEREADFKARYPKSHRSPVNRSHISSAKAAAYWFFSWSFWITAIDHFNIFRVFPRRIRYSIYDVITFSQSRIFPR